MLGAYAAFWSKKGSIVPITSIVTWDDCSIREQFEMTWIPKPEIQADTLSDCWELALSRMIMHLPPKSETP